MKNRGFAIAGLFLIILISCSFFVSGAYSIPSNEDSITIKYDKDFNSIPIGKYLGTKSNEDIVATNVVITQKTTSQGKVAVVHIFKGEKLLIPLIFREQKNLQVCMKDFLKKERKMNLFLKMENLFLLNLQLLKIFSRY